MEEEQQNYNKRIEENPPIAAEALRISFDNRELSVTSSTYDVDQLSQLVIGLLENQTISKALKLNGSKDKPKYAE